MEDKLLQMKRGVQFVALFQIPRMKLSDKIPQLEVEICNRNQNTNHIELQILVMEILIKIRHQETIVTLKTLAVIPLKVEKNPIREVKIPEDKIMLILHNEVD